MTAETVMEPVHPGEILMEEFLKPLERARVKGRDKALSWGFGLERAKGIETSRPAWKPATGARRTGAHAGRRSGPGPVRDPDYPSVTLRTGTQRARSFAD